MLMGPEHPRWSEYRRRLRGVEGLNFRPVGEKRWEFSCPASRDLPLSANVLAAMGEKDLLQSTEKLVALYGRCDCEVLFNSPD